MSASQSLVVTVIWMFRRHAALVDENTAKTKYQTRCQLHPSCRSLIVMF